MHALWSKEIWRWMLAAGVVIAAFFATLCFSVFVLLGGPFRSIFGEHTVGFVMGFSIVLAGSFFAPRHRFVTAIVLALGASLGAIFVKISILGPFAGSLLAVGFMAWWLHPRRTMRSVFCVSITGGLGFVVFICVLYLRYVDKPARADQPPPELAEILGTNATSSVTFYHYDLGGFVDHESLWRIDADPGIVTLVVNGLSLRSTNAVPRQFWRMAPHYWPREMPAGAEAFQSQMFTGEGRGHDGNHYFLLHDKPRGKAYVWFKGNF